MHDNRAPVLRPLGWEGELVPRNGRASLQIRPWVLAATEMTGGKPGGSANGEVMARVSFYLGPMRSVEVSTNPGNYTATGATRPGERWTAVRLHNPVSSFQD